MKEGKAFGHQTANRQPEDNGDATQQSPEVTVAGEVKQDRFLIIDTGKKQLYTITGQDNRSAHCL